MTTLVMLLMLTMGQTGVCKPGVNCSVNTMRTAVFSAATLPACTVAKRGTTLTYTAPPALASISSAIMSDADQMTLSVGSNLCMAWCDGSAWHCIGSAYAFAPPICNPNVPASSDSFGMYCAPDIAGSSLTIAGDAGFGGNLTVSGMSISNATCPAGVALVSDGGALACANGLTNATDGGVKQLLCLSPSSCFREWGWDPWGVLGYVALNKGLTTEGSLTASVAGYVPTWATSNAMVMSGNTLGNSPSLDAVGGDALVTSWQRSKGGRFLWSSTLAGSVANASLAVDGFALAGIATGAMTPCAPLSDGGYSDYRTVSGNPSGMGWSSAQGLLAFNATTHAPQYCDGLAWRQFAVVETVGPCPNGGAIIYINGGHAVCGAVDAGPSANTNVIDTNSNFGGYYPLAAADASHAFAQTRMPKAGKCSRMTFVPAVTGGGAGNAVLTAEMPDGGAIGSLTFACTSAVWVATGADCSGTWSATDDVTLRMNTIDCQGAAPIGNATMSYTE